MLSLVLFDLLRLCGLSCVVFDCDVSARCLMLRLIVMLVCSALCCILVFDCYVSARCQF